MQSYGEEYLPISNISNCCTTKKYNYDYSRRKLSHTYNFIIFHMQNTKNCRQNITISSLSIISKLRLQRKIPIRSRSWNTGLRDYAWPSFQILHLTQHAVSFATPRMWNSLSTKMKDLNSFPWFKRSLKAYLLSDY